MFNLCHDWDVFRSSGSALTLIDSFKGSTLYQVFIFMRISSRIRSTFINLTTSLQITFVKQINLIPIFSFCLNYLCKRSSIVNSFQWLTMLLLMISKVMTAIYIWGIHWWSSLLCPPAGHSTCTVKHETRENKRRSWHVWWF